MEPHQLELDLSSHFEREGLERTASAYMTRSLILDLLLELHRLGAYIPMDHWILQEGEATIMRSLVQAGVQTEDLIKVNRYRMWTE